MRELRVENPLTLSNHISHTSNIINKHFFSETLKRWTEILKQSSGFKK